MFTRVASVSCFPLYKRCFSLTSDALYSNGHFWPHCEVIGGQRPSRFDSIQKNPVLNKSVWHGHDIPALLFKPPAVNISVRLNAPSVCSYSWLHFFPFAIVELCQHLGFFRFEKMKTTQHSWLQVFTSCTSVKVRIIKHVAFFSVLKYTLTWHLTTQQRSLSRFTSSSKNCNNSWITSTKYLCVTKVTRSRKNRFQCANEEK